MTRRCRERCRSRRGGGGAAEAAAPDLLGAYASPKDIARVIKNLEREMREAARNLEFERAADVRDRIQALRARMLVAESGEEAL